MLLVKTREKNKNLGGKGEWKNIRLIFVSKIFGVRNLDSEREKKTRKTGKIILLYC